VAEQDELTELCCVRDNLSQVGWTSCGLGRLDAVRWLAVLAVYIIEEYIII